MSIQKILEVQVRLTVKFKNMNIFKFACCYELVAATERIIFSDSMLETIV